MPFQSSAKNFTMVLIAAITLSSCSEITTKKTDPAAIPELVLAGNEGLFRTMNLGDDINTVLKKETAKPLEVDSAYLYYEYALPDSVGSFNVTYNFDEKGLFEIQSIIFINNAEVTEEVQNRFKSYFDNYYGSSQTEMGFNIWSVKSEKFGQVKINLTDESSDFTIDNAPGKLSLWIYKEESNS
ncbi:MAG: hypothetical protein WAQ28_09405 [Bacteroidia bacterium]|jgi:hypothetical protein